ncbi:aminotransferase class V-fold PLP-dependent enzyme [Roseofilum casamattae]|uniref:Aminotransferase class V-fold PLP-dependent enzyme n=1 Tax=Roseofilum casamattae BLCC-M143 TaxID=3022442 RepID=A0ABT7BY57_9CYAN|nr:aminotransferase class V-fold PLP-dependent enzyme [Roseofilum casamattae]MDJ1183742.1 aminotransferase class V-fold PLP-dependent enzyme [Roseofilum casamattae BLCC-M143]
MDYNFTDPDLFPSWKQWWTLDPDRIYLNHGAFGACPRPVLEQQKELRAQLERNPTRFMVHELEPLLDEARDRLAEFVGAKSAELAFIPNTTTGISTVLRSLSFAPGDELLTTTQEYNACRNALDFVAARTGANVVTVPVPFPFENEEMAIAAILSGISEKTRLVLLDHITSVTSLIFPIQQLARELRDRQIDFLVDGAHVPGQIPLNLAELGVTYYCGNCHKWLCSPKGAAFLYVREDKQSLIHPLTISHGANSSRRDRSRFHLEFDWTGSNDPTPYLCLPATLDFINTRVPGGWMGLMESNHHKVIQARQVLCDALGIAPLTGDRAIGSMASLPLPEGCARTLYRQLSEEKGIEVAIKPFPHPPHRLLRICAQIYNDLNDYQQLAIALNTLL